MKKRIVPVFNQSHYLINSICLPKTRIINEKKESIFLIGLGLEEPTGRVSKRLKKEMTFMLDPEFCRLLGNISNFTAMVCYQRINSSIIPLWNSSGQRGDSGSPSHQYLNYCKAVQIGVVSYGSPYSQRSARVSFFTPWIRSKILSENNFTQNVKRMVWETNHLLIVSVITTAIIAVLVCSALLWSESYSYNDL